MRGDQWRGACGFSKSASGLARARRESQMGAAFGHTRIHADRAIEIACLHPQGQSLGIVPSLLLEERRHPQRVGQVQLWGRLLGAIDIDGFQDERLGLHGAVHPTENVSDVADGVGQVHLVVEAAIEHSGGAIVADSRLVFSQVALDFADLDMNGGEQLLLVVGAACFKGIAEQPASVLAPLFGERGAATFKQRSGGQMLHSERLARTRALRKRSAHTACRSGNILGMAYFLFKTEPDVYSFDDFLRDKETVWDGVTNPTAVKYLREMKAGTKWIFYHTGDERTAVGTGTVVSVDSADPKVPIVKVKVGKRIKKPKTLAEIKAEPLFAKSPLVVIGRLSVVPLTEEQWDWLAG
jgi:predicted RNA-binding protein with PUA-like domain